MIFQYINKTSKKLIIQSCFTVSCYSQLLGESEPSRSPRTKQLVSPTSKQLNSFKWTLRRQKYANSLTNNIFIVIRLVDESRSGPNFYIFCVESLKETDLIVVSIHDFFLFSVLFSVQ